MAGGLEIPPPPARIRPGLRAPLGVPAFQYRGSPLVSIGSARRHVSLYVMYGDVLKSHAADLLS
jgi:hypothetical protein